MRLPFLGPLSASHTLTRATCHGCGCPASAPSRGSPNRQSLLQGSPSAELRGLRAAASVCPRLFLPSLCFLFSIHRCPACTAARSPLASGSTSPLPTTGVSQPTSCKSDSVSVSDSWRTPQTSPASPIQAPNSPSPSFDFYSGFLCLSAFTRWRLG